MLGNSLDRLNLGKLNFALNNLFSANKKNSMAAEPTGEHCWPPMENPKTFFNSETLMSCKHIFSPKGDVFLSLSLSLSVFLSLSLSLSVSLSLSISTRACVRAPVCLCLCVCVWNARLNQRVWVRPFGAVKHYPVLADMALRPLSHVSCTQMGVSENITLTSLFG